MGFLIKRIDAIRDINEKDEKPPQKEVSIYQVELGNLLKNHQNTFDEQARIISKLIEDEEYHDSSFVSELRIAILKFEQEINKTIYKFKIVNEIIN